MKHTYKLSGMHCNSCKEKISELLSVVPHVEHVEVNLENKVVDITMDEHINISVLKSALENSSYGIHLPSEEIPTQESTNNVSSIDNNPNARYHCPMNCEGDKTYSEPGSCPVCGMALVAELSTTSPKTENTESKKLLFKLWIATAFTVPIFIIAMLLMLKPSPLNAIMDQIYWDWIQFILSLPVIFYATWMFFQRAYASIVRKSLNMFTLIGIGAGAAVIFSIVGLLFPDIFPEQFKSEDGNVHIYFEAATVILTLVLLGQVLEDRAHNKTNSAVEELIKLAPKNAVRIQGEEEVVIQIDQIKVNDILRVKPGDKIPVDGKITEGNATIDESMISGEPVPVEKNVEDTVTSGTINGNTSFLMKAEKIGSDTLLSQIIHMVNSASRSKAPIQKTVDTISSYFVPIVIALSALTFLIWAIWGPDPKFVYAFVNAVAVLIIACPCALGLATPISIMVGMGKGATEGVLIKDAESLETFSSIDTLIVDKTGTLTEGRPTVEKIITLNTEDEFKVLQTAASLNKFSEHPLAKAILEYAKSSNVNLVEISDFESITGKGVTAFIDESPVFIGNNALVEKANAELDEKLEQRMITEKKLGKTVPAVIVDGNVIGAIVISDKIKENTIEAVRQIKSKGIQIILMTGDNEFSAKYVADTVGISEFEANCLPEDKLKRIERLQSEGVKVGMVGDGINDAPALALSDVGIAMGTGTDIAIESSQITLINGDIHGVVKALNLSRGVMRNIRQNLFFAMVYNSVGVPIAAGLLYPLFGMLLSPMIAALAMSFSSVSVIFNALRLKRISIK